MSFREIIKENTDRLFIVDTECFIIFTGSSINDERPFIRIGTWYDLPVEIIPFTENIILSDRILGNPAHEQFNIDIKNLIANRYIGSESILKRFLDYQKNFGLDLTNVSIVNIEKDLPELPRQSSISDRDQFIGVFYSDGNIKIVNDGIDIFNLNTQFSENTSISGIQDHISRECKGRERYAGTGFVITDSNPLFYSGGYFTSYQYPSTPLTVFSRLDIDPSRIREVLLPTQNIMTLSSLMKFKHSREGKIKIFSDNPEQVELIKRLFKNSTVVDERFSSLNYATGDGLRLINYDNSPNIKLVYRMKTPAQDELTVAFIKLHHDTKKILKENPDLVLITYTAYEESALIFKSSGAPVLLIDDGNRNLKKIGDSIPVAMKGMQYELRKLSQENDIASLLGVPEDITSAFTEKNTGAIENYMRSAAEEKDNPVLTFNAETMLKFHINNTGDRKFFGSLKQIHQEIFSRRETAIPEDEAGSFRIILVLHKNSCYQVLEKNADPRAEYFTDIYSPETVRHSGITAIQAELGERILHDRERLARLLRHFYEDRRSSGRHVQLEELVQNLKYEINSRKEVYSIDQAGAGEFIARATGGRGKKSGQYAGGGIYSHEGPDAEGEGHTGKGAGAIETGITSLPGVMASVITGKEKDGTPVDTGTRVKRGLIISIPMLIVIALIITLLYRYSTRTSGTGVTQFTAGETTGQAGQVITVKRANSEEKALLAQRNVVIRDIDIYNYANDVAMKNGYEKITYSGLRDKNPHWIYPSNVFIMLDGEKVVVQRGDTLWDLAHAKLEKMNADFYKIIEEIEKTDPSDSKKIHELAAKAAPLAYIQQQKEIISKYMQKAGNEQ